MSAAYRNGIAALASRPQSFRARRCGGRLLAGIATAVFSLLVLAVPRGHAAALRFDVFLGHDNMASDAAWFPVAFEIANEGPAFNAVVEITADRFGDGQTYEMPVELPTGTTKRFVIPVFASSRGMGQWTARLLDERRRVRAEAPGLQLRRQLPRRLLLAGAFSRRTIKLPDVPSGRGDVQPAVARLQPSVFPENPITLEALDAIYLSSEKALELKAGQASALLAWLWAGGHLIVGVDQVSHFAGAGWLRNVLPVKLDTLSQAVAGPEIDQWLRSSLGPNGVELRFEGPLVYRNLPSAPAFRQASLQIATGSLRDGQVLIGSSDRPVAVFAPRGRGQITVLMFTPELDAFDSWELRPHFWAKLFNVPPDTFTSERYNAYLGQSIDAVVGAMIDSRQVRKLPVGWLMLLLLAYLAVIGPWDRWSLRKINRPMLTWITFPIYVALFSGLIYLIGYKLRAGVTELNELHVVDVMPTNEQADLRGWSYTSIYSPANARYGLACELPFASLRNEYSGFRGSLDSGRNVVEQHGHHFAAKVSVPVWTSQLYVNDWRYRTAPPLTAKIVRARGEWDVTLHNRLSHKLTGVHLVVEGRVHLIGDLAPDQTLSKRIARGEGTELGAFVQQNSRLFLDAAQRRHQAFGDDTRSRLELEPAPMVAATFLSRGETAKHQHELFSTPPGFDLTPLVDRGDAVLLALLPDQSLVKPTHQFSPTRHQRNTFLRLAVPVEGSH